jgi:hypothetical protein
VDGSNPYRPGLRARRLLLQMLMRLILLVLMAMLVAGPLGWRVYRHFIPSGTDFYPFGAFWESIVEGPTLVSPDGRRMIQVMFCDAGAAHSGNHWTWLIFDNWLTGKRVIAEGYSLAEVRKGKWPFPLRWDNDRTISVGFAASRYESASRNPVVVRLP